MRAERHLQGPADGADVTILGGCPVCDGDLAVRIAGGRARGFCARCSRLSEPRIIREGERIHVIHPAAALA